MNHRPYALLAELTYRCPLHCPYCSNPTRHPAENELATEEWRRVIREAAAIGVLQAGFSGGEPLLRSDLASLVAEARENGIYTNLITSGVGFDERRAAELRAAGLDSAQISFQADDAALADGIAGARAHHRKLEAARLVREHGIALSVNVVLHRANLSRLRQIIEFAASLGTKHLELANTQYYGWGFLNRAPLAPTRAQVDEARQIALEEKQRHAGRMDIFYVLPDYYEQRPKPCLQGWGRRYLTVNPTGDVLPCPTASSIAGMRFDNARDHSVAWIWNESESFNRFRGTAWMPEPCQSCPQREIDFGGCRCQAALLTGNAAATDPVCSLSPDRKVIDGFLARIEGDELASTSWIPRENPAKVH